jgi:hypothetical protein
VREFRRTGVAYRNRHDRPRPRVQRRDDRGEKRAKTAYCRGNHRRAKNRQTRFDTARLGVYLWGVRDGCAQRTQQNNNDLFSGCSPPPKTHTSIAATRARGFPNHGPFSFFTRNTSILLVFAWPASAGWCEPGPPGLARVSRTGFSLSRSPCFSLSRKVRLFVFGVPLARHNPLVMLTRSSRESLSHRRRALGQFARRTQDVR